MPVPQIPNLLTLRGRGGRLARGRGRGREAGLPIEDEQESPEEAQRRKDETIRRTDDDANGSRLSAVAIGLLDDPFAQYFGELSKAPRRMPIINRGTYYRTNAMNRLVDSFMNSCTNEGTKAQIISLGAGTDTRFLNLVQQGAHDLVYHEVDLAENVRNKTASINRHPKLRQMISGTTDSIIEDGISVCTPAGNRYQIQSLDLRDLSSRQDPSSSNASKKIKGIEPDFPTLIISECCLCYLTPEQVQSVFSHLLSSESGMLSPETRVGLIFYEPINPQDSFGQTMVRNLRQRGIEMPTVPVFPDLGSQRTRFAEYGLNGGARATDMHRISKLWFTEDQQEEISRKNPLDEVEEWQLLAQHYCISWGWRGSSGWIEWQELPE